MDDQDIIDWWRKKNIQSGQELSEVLDNFAIVFCS